MNTLWPCLGSFPADTFMLHADTVHIWQVVLEQEASVIAQLHEALSADERQRAARFYFPADQQRYIIGRGVLRVLLSRYLNDVPSRLSFIYNAYGKPELATPSGVPPLQFNLSHSGGSALYAITLQRHLGIDIERIRPDLEWQALAGQVFSPHEQAVLANVPAAEQCHAFFRGWTRKEAYIKARGMGLSLSLTEIDVTLEADAPAKVLATRDDPQEAARWTLRDVPCPPGYAAAIAVAGDGWHSTFSLL